MSTPHDDASIDFSTVLSYLTQARWFGGKGRDASVSAVRRAGRIGTGTEPVVVIDLVEVSYAAATGHDTQTELYQLPLALYSEPQERLEHALVGQWNDPEHGPVLGYDALHDREAMAAWLSSLDATAPATQAESGQSASSSSASDPLHFHRLPGHDLDVSAHSTLFSGEQSNSSVMFGEDALLKVFRKVSPGRNPDIAVHDVLTRAGSDHVAPLYGWVSAGDVDLAMLQAFLRTAADGWDLALASVRDLFAEADLHAEEVGGDFAGEAARLGAALAQVHATLAAEFPTRSRTTQELRELAVSMNERLDHALAVAPVLAEHEEALRRAYDDVAHHPGDVAQRVHGDLHLGQTLRTARGWKIVDFEGEPAKPLAERELPDSVWRDVAGMMRSFDYAPRVVGMTVADRPESAGEAGSQREFRAGEWSARNRQVFLTSYLDGRELTDADRALLAAYVADKAVYETVYETRNRPTWVGIPLAAIGRELRTGGTQ